MNEQAETGETFAAGDLAEAIQGENGHLRAAEAVARLDEAAKRINDRMAGGLSLGEAEGYRAVSRALATARSVMLLAAAKALRA